MIRGCDNSIFYGLSGEWTHLRNKGEIKKLQVNVYNNLISLPNYLLSIASVDIILEASWLATLGFYMLDYSKLSHQFF